MAENIGLRVKVFVDTEEGERKYIGLGTIVGEEVIYVVDKHGRVLEEGTTPKIKLDDGREILGLQCWWLPKDEADRAEKEIFGRVVYE